MLVTSVSPSLGVFVTCPNQGQAFVKGAPVRRARYGAKSAPPQIWHRRRQLVSNPRTQLDHGPASLQMPRPCTTVGGRRVRIRPSCPTTDTKLKVDDVVWLAEHAREVTSLENRRSVMEEAQKAIRQEATISDTSRPHSVIGVGLQAMTSPMPLSAKKGHRSGQVDHIPALLSLPSDRTFIPSPDYSNARHVTTPADDMPLPDERSQSVARQCCEIMGPSLCRTCRKMESRLLNRERAEKECPRMRITQENITTTQIVKRFYPGLTDSEIQDKIARGEIARTGFLSRKCRHHRYSNSDGEDSDDSDDQTSSEESSVKRDDTKKKQKYTCHHASHLMVELAKLKMKLKNQTSTPLYFTDLKRIQSKILSGEVDRKKFLTKQPQESLRLKSAISTVSTASSAKSTLSKLGVRLSESLMPVFVSPRKVKMCDEPSYKVYYEPPLLSKRRQIPNPSFFAGSSEAYSLPERLPDIIEFADSKIKQLEKQGRSVSSLSMFSNASEDNENLNSERGPESAKSTDNSLNRSGTQRELRTQNTITEQSEPEFNQNNEERPVKEGSNIDQVRLMNSISGVNYTAEEPSQNTGNVLDNNCEQKNTVISHQGGHPGHDEEGISDSKEIITDKNIPHVATDSHHLVGNDDNNNEMTNCEILHDMAGQTFDPSQDNLKATINVTINSPDGKPGATLICGVTDDMSHSTIPLPNEDDDEDTFRVESDVHGNQSKVNGLLEVDDTIDNGVDDNVVGDDDIFDEKDENEESNNAVVHSDSGGLGDDLECSANQREKQETPNSREEEEEDEDNDDEEDDEQEQEEYDNIIDEEQEEGEQRDDVENEVEEDDD